VHFSLLLDFASFFNEDGKYIVVSVKLKGFSIPGFFTSFFSLNSHRKDLAALYFTSFCSVSHVSNFCEGSGNAWYLLNFGIRCRRMVSFLLQEP
jgi:hypothetical protein